MDEDRYRKLQICDWEPHLFTTEASKDSFLFVKNCTQLAHMGELDPEKDVLLVLTAWKNKYRVQFKNFFRAGYSSHSNASEIEQFVKSVCPK